MNRSILITRPDDDSVLTLLCIWTETVIHLARKHNFAVFDLKSRKSNKKDFDSYIKRNNPSFLVFNGHGSETTIIGYDNEPLVSLGKDESLLKHKIIYSRTCNSAAKLGKESVKSGCQAFLGYLKPFWLPRSKTSGRNISKDKIAKRFLDPTNLIPTTLIKGHTAAEANQRSKETMIRSYREMVSSISSFEERSIAFFLYCNLRNQVLIGNPKARIYIS